MNCPFCKGDMILQEDDPAAVVPYYWLCTACEAEIGCDPGDVGYSPTTEQAVKGP